MSSATPYIAAYAALVSTAVAGWQFLRERPRYKITDGPEQVFDETSEAFAWRVVVVNLSTRPVTFEQRRCWLFGDDNEEMHGTIQGHTDGVLVVGPGETRVFVFELPYEGVVAVVLNDSLGRRRIRHIDGTSKADRKRVETAIARPAGATFYG